MASKRAGRGGGKLPESASAATERPLPTDGPSSGATEARGATPRRDVRRFIYAGFDAAMAAVYVAALMQGPTRHAGGRLLLWSTVAAILVAGAGMLLRGRWGWRLAVAGCAWMLVVTVTVLVLVVLSASFLAGVFGSMGRGAAIMSLLAGALAIELYGFLPALQLKYLMTRAGRRAMGLGPLWR